ncbi:hypothetical protein F4775DRAFT_560380 [Biscogniauxia sp. FL1348]|nr:hypothetical protein F4775DRAFT_560380 [Biscogniauxia sp. FL1348]
MEFRCWVLLIYCSSFPSGVSGMRESLEPGAQSSCTAGRMDSGFESPYPAKADNITNGNGKNNNKPKKAPKMTTVLFAVLGCLGTRNTWLAMYIGR